MSEMVDVSGEHVRRVSALETALRAFESALCVALGEWQLRVNETREHSDSGLGHAPRDAAADRKIEELRQLLKGTPHYDGSCGCD